MENQFDTRWNINGGADYDHPWVQVAGESRPYLYFQNVYITNGVISNSELSSYLVTHNDVKVYSRGFRFAKVSDPYLWTSIPSVGSKVGTDIIDIDKALQNDIAYYIQPYAKIEDHYCYGNMVRYAKYDVLVPSIKPFASDVQIEGIVNFGETLTGTYLYIDTYGLEESGTKYKWYLSDDEIGTNKNEISNATSVSYAPLEGDQGKYISFEVMPSNGFMQGDKVETNLIFVESKLSQTILDFNIPNRVDVDDEIDLIATSTSDLPVTYIVNDPLVAKVVNHKITF